MSVALVRLSECVPNSDTSKLTLLRAGFAFEGAGARRARVWGPEQRHGRDASAQHRAGTGEGADRAEEPRLQHAPTGATGAPRCGGANVMVTRGEVCLESPLRGQQTRRGAGEYRKPRRQPRS